MGPNKSEALFTNHYEQEIDRLVNERQATEAASDILAGLSHELDEYPVKSPTTDPMLPAKLYALAHITNDPMGLSGLSPMEYISFDRNEVKVEAYSAPYHDIFEDEKSGVKIRTRVIRIIPANEDAYGRERVSEPDLEFFGLNVYTDQEEDREDLIAMQIASDETEVKTPLPEGVSAYPLVLADAPFVLSGSGLIITHRRPISGVTNIFAVRHKESGAVKIYAIDTVVDPLARGGFEKVIERTSLNSVSFGVQNLLKVTVTELKDAEFEQAIAEFKAARAALGVAKAMNPDEHQLSPQERFAYRQALRGASESPEVEDLHLE